MQVKLVIVVGVTGGASVGESASRPQIDAMKGEMGVLIRQNDAPVKFMQVGPCFSVHKVLFMMFLKVVEVG